MNKFYNPSIFNYCVIFFSGVFATLANPPFSLLPLIFFIGFSIYSINQIKSLLKTFIAGWFLGFGWFLSGLYWIGSAFIVADTYHFFLMPIAVILLPSVLAMFWGLSFFCAKIVSKKSNNSIIYIIIFLSIFEFIRAKLFTGFPWLMPSMPLSSNEYLIQIFSIVGSFTANLVTLIVSVLPFILFSNFNGKYTLTILLIIPTSVLFIFSFSRFYNKDSLNTNNLLITIIQPNIEQKNKWKFKNREQHFKKLLTLSKNEVDEFSRIIIWPETSFEGSIPSEMKLLSSISKKLIKSSKTTLVVGLLRTETNKIFNSLVFLNSQGKIIYQYDKTKLVPFGEYIPLRNYLGSLAKLLALKDFTSGKFVSNASLDGYGKIITLICYEILFADKILNRISKNTNLLINITNDAWFGKTIGPYQHLALAKIKAVEFGIPLARVANTGISAFISPYGEILSKIPLFKEGAKTIQLVRPLDNTFYKIYGNYIFIISILFLIIINIIHHLNFKKES